MTIYIILLVLIPTVWMALEIWLVIRDASHGRGKTSADRGTRSFNFIAILAGIGIAALLNGISRFFFPGGRSITVFIIGIALMLAGMALRFWAVATLGTAFRTTIETHQDQKVVESGPYRLVRHPSYSGSLLICLGYGIALQNWLSLLAAVGLPLIALLYRIKAEEVELSTALGAEYVEYQKRTKKLIPWVW
jgi:protein-S-isoprenylcysteine O-methyltransferase Ste14